jgi:hypothetical protein
VTCNAQNATVATDALAPQVDHHQHLLSPQAAALLNNPGNPPAIPQDVAQVLKQHEEFWNDPARLAGIYSADALTLNGDDGKWVQGRSDVAGYLGTRFARPYQVTGAAGIWPRITRVATARSGGISDS